MVQLDGCCGSVVNQLVEARIRVSDLPARRAAAHSFAAQTPIVVGECQMLFFVLEF